MITQRRLGENPLIENQVEAYESVDKQKRYKQIIEILTEGKEMTAKEIAVEMYKRGYTPTSERNFASPRITELLRTGVLDCLGKKKCEYSGKSVSVFGLLNENI
jgi:hypothetical protein